MPLTMARAGQEMSVQQIRGREDTKRFLESLGFVVGGRVTVINEINGNLILRVKESRIALDKSMAHRILVA